ncbi:hypothetical protein D3C87_482660 [compost metagenome]
MKASEILSEAHMKVLEHASGGGSSAGGIATVVGGLGAGFNPNADHGIYGENPKKKKSKKPTVIRR